MSDKGGHLRRLIWCPISKTQSYIRRNCIIYSLLRICESHVFAGPMNPGAALIVKSCGTHISANVRGGALSHKIDPLT